MRLNFVCSLTHTHTEEDKHVACFILIDNYVLIAITSKTVINIWHDFKK